MFKVTHLPDRLELPGCESRLPCSVVVYGGIRIIRQVISVILLLDQCCEFSCFCFFLCCFYCSRRYTVEGSWRRREKTTNTFKCCMLIVSIALCFYLSLIVYQNVLLGILSRPMLPILPNGYPKSNNTDDSA